MITSALINKVHYFVYSKAKIDKTPSTFHLDYANDKGQTLAQKLKADQNIVLLGTLLMDCMLGEAIMAGNGPKHIMMSVEKAKDILVDSKISQSEKDNVIYCIRQHHGSNHFYSMESEICCNADCYRFISIKGMLGGMLHGPTMQLSDLVKLYSQKADEKWQALSIGSCKKELEPEYRHIKSFLGSFKN